MNKTRVYIAETAVLKDDSLFGKLYNIVSVERQVRIDSYLFPKDKRLSLAAELLMRYGFQAEGLDEYPLGYGENGKPYIQGRSDIFFNLSHSEERVMCAVSGRDVGCDVEKVTEIDLEIARRFFYGSEYERIAREQTLSRRYDTFFRLWTLKESFMKATGLGMALPLDAFQIHIGDRISLRQSVSGEIWHFKEYDFKDGYKYAVCGLTPDFAEAEFVSFQ